MRKTKNFSSKMLAVLTAAMIFGFTSCNNDENNEPEEVGFSYSIMGSWHNVFTDGRLDSRYGFNFKIDGTYSYITQNENINGTYRIIERQETTYDAIDYISGIITTYNVTLLKILASGSSAFDQFWVYYSDNVAPHIFVNLYSKNELIKDLGGFMHLLN